MTFSPVLLLSDLSEVWSLFHLADTVAVRTLAEAWNDLDIHWDGWNWPKMTTFCSLQISNFLMAWNDLPQAMRFKAPYSWNSRSSVRSNRYWVFSKEKQYCKMCLDFTFGITEWLHDSESNQTLYPRHGNSFHRKSGTSECSIVDKPENAHFEILCFKSKEQVSVHVHWHAYNWIIMWINGVKDWGEVMLDTSNLQFPKFSW